MGGASAGGWGQGMVRCWAHLSGHRPGCIATWQQHLVAFQVDSSIWHMWCRGSCRLSQSHAACVIATSVSSRCHLPHATCLSRDVPHARLPAGGKAWRSLQQAAGPGRPTGQARSTCCSATTPSASCSSTLTLRA